MIVSWNWLTDYLRLDMTAEVLAERLALTGLNHESTEEVGGDLAIDLEVTSNRPDCLGHLGVAREIGVIFDLPMRFPDPRPATSGPRVETLASVAVDEPGLCPRFTARAMTGVTVGQSPWWLRKRLETLGQRPVNNVVDATNYVMFEAGQPLHAYDLARLEGRSLRVRKATKGEPFKAINNKAYDLDAETLVIADAARVVGIAGVMGGFDTEIGDSSRDVLLEAAQFDASSVRRTVRLLNLPSEASRRFERAMDPEATDWASRRCAQLIMDLAGGTLHPGVLDVGVPRAPRRPITLRLGQIERILGITIDRSEVARILKALGLSDEGSTADSLTVVPPSWRADLEREIDLIEEVGRIHGYENVPEDRVVPLVSTSRGVRERVEAEVRSTLTGLGFDESATYSLVTEGQAAPLNPTPDDAPPIRVNHSSRKRETCLRRSLVPSLLAVRGYNESHGQAEADFFEIGQVYLPRPGGLPEEPTRLAIVGKTTFLDLKGVIEALVGRLHVPGALTFEARDLPLFAAGKSAEIRVDGQWLGDLGEIERAGLGKLDVDLRGPTCAAELSFNLLQDRSVLVPQHKPLPTSPPVTRDLSLVVERGLPWGDLAAEASRAAGALLESVQYLDSFSGGNVPEGRQSVHFGMRFRHPGRTLTGDEVDGLVAQVVAACAAAFGATLRT
jgi:phenylalanyl-tRNA synthetase beta chain